MTRILPLMVVVLFMACTRAPVPSTVGVEPESSPPTTVPGTTESAASLTITLWHGWTEQEVDSLDRVISGFEGLHPGITVLTRSVPFDELKSEALAAWSDGVGPTLLFGASDWAAELRTTELVREVAGTVPSAVLDRILPSALKTAEVDGNLIGVPHALSGVVLYRNTTLLPTPPGTLEELLAVDGVVLERGFFFSMGHLVSACGGTLVNPDGTAGFADAAGECWLALLATFPGEYYSDADLEAFKAGEVPMIIDGTWSLAGIVDSLGEDVVAIDPWPTLAGGRLAGVVRTEVMYLGGLASPDETAAALVFVEHVIGDEAQLILSDPAGAGHIPVVGGLTEVDGPRFGAGESLGGGVALAGFGDCYWGAMDTALQGYFSGSLDAMGALATAADAIDTAVLSGTCGRTADGRSNPG